MGRKGRRQFWLNEILWNKVCSTRWLPLKSAKINLILNTRPFYVTSPITPPSPFTPPPPLPPLPYTGYCTNELIATRKLQPSIYIDDRNTSIAALYNPAGLYGWIRATYLCKMCNFTHSHWILPIHPPTSCSTSTSSFNHLKKVFNTLLCLSFELQWLTF